MFNGSISTPASENSWKRPVHLTGFSFYSSSLDLGDKMSSNQTKDVPVPVNDDGGVNAGGSDNGGSDTGSVRSYRARMRALRKGTSVALFKQNERMISCLLLCLLQPSVLRRPTPWLFAATRPASRRARPSLSACWSWWSSSSCSCWLAAFSVAITCGSISPKKNRRSFTRTAWWNNGLELNTHLMKRATPRRFSSFSLFLVEEFGVTGKSSANR